MPGKKTSLLIVDDEPSIRALLSQVLTESGYAVRSTNNAFSALVEICHKVPEFLISDLSTPDFSGFEFLRVVRRQFPSIRVIAMSGALSGDKIPSGVFADAFFKKGTGFDVLLSILEALPHPDRWAQQPVLRRRRPGSRVPPDGCVMPMLNETPTLSINRQRVAQ
jgi:twitching motility two-component system response regulator PilH